jgi:hypothetical protein
MEEQEKKEYYLEYSVGQNNFHVGTLDEIKQENVGNCFSNPEKSIDFLIIYGPDTFDGCMHKTEYFIKKNNLKLDF